MGTAAGGDRPRLLCGSPLPCRVPRLLGDREVRLRQALAAFGDHVRRFGFDALDPVMDLSIPGLDLSIFMYGSP